ncbi:hypothetical protein Cus16_1968 [Curtobacterium sp. ER1/6]|nr:hypothetical protein Cus16_1968 [Curtobacterium sp. ER1/6]
MELDRSRGSRRRPAERAGRAAHVRRACTISRPAALSVTDVARSPAPTWSGGADRGRSGATMPEPVSETVSLAPQPPSPRRAGRTCRSRSPSVRDQSPGGAERDGCGTLASADLVRRR